MTIARYGFRLLLACSFFGASDGIFRTALHAETRTAAALTPEAVWEAVNAAKDGDTVEFPAGTAVWSRGWNTGHWAKMKAITIRGAGIDKTIIRDATSRASGDEPFVIQGVEGKPFRITGITFDGTGLPDAGVWAGEIVIGGNCKNFRVDHCKFLNMDRMMTIHGDTYGLVDHCCFHALKKNRRAQTIMYEGPGKANYRKPLSLGTAEAVYFEDNDVQFSPEVVNPDGRRSRKGGTSSTRSPSPNTISRTSIRILCNEGRDAPSPPGPSFWSLGVRRRWESPSIPGIGLLSIE